MPPFPAAFSVLASVLAAFLLQASPSRADDDCIVIDNFASAKVGEFPPDWKVRKDAAKQTYQVREEAGTRFLHASAQATGMQVARQFDQWDLDTYPVLAWRWRAIEFPKGGDERQSSGNDSALAVYMLVPYSKIRGPQAVKYIWSEQVPTGTELESNLGLTKVRVLRSGSSETGKWTEERVDVRADFLKAFGPKATPKPGGIAVLTDADDTSSTAAGDYADFRACRK